MLRRT